MDDALLNLAGVVTNIGAYHILHGVDLTVRRGRVTMLLGRNGAGKTTTLRSIMGLWKPRAGSVRFDGAEIAGSETPDIARRGIAYVPETMGIFSQLTVAENMRLAATTSRFDEARLEDVFRFFPILKTKWHDRAGLMSGGQKQMLAVARAIVEERRLMIIDEPTKGLAPSVIDDLIACILEQKARGTTILLVEQNFHMARSVGDDVAVMDNGRVIHAGSMADLAGDESLQTRLLGLSLDSHQ
ncbi:MAG: ABC transporter ATP-binding protein [Acetobacteraceae bacterium]|nr:ABC transporter ATP-binding protein [Acetobacteraceae bacterium]